MIKLTPKDLERLEQYKEILKEYAFELIRLEKEKESKAFLRSSKLFKDAFKRQGGLPFETEINAVYWAYDLINLARELVISFCWMEAHANQYKKINQPGTKPSHSSVYVSFYADNCVTLIDSFKDKLALMVWAFYKPFNPEKKVLDYDEIIKSLKESKKFNLRKQKPFLRYLQKLKAPHFKIVEMQRHLKIHRLSPRIEIFKAGPQSYDYYMLPLTGQNEINAWRKDLLKRCNNDRSMARQIEKGCYINGILYDRRPLKGRLFEYKDVRRDIKYCLLDSLSALSKCLNLLKRRAL
jgi:hypothetical protein